MLTKAQIKNNGVSNVVSRKMRAAEAIGGRIISAGASPSLASDNKKNINAIEASKMRPIWLPVAFALEFRFQRPQHLLSRCPRKTRILY